MNKFRRTSYDAIFKQLGWHSEIAFLDLHCYKLQERLISDGLLSLGSPIVTVNSLKDELMSIIVKLRQNRFFDIALKMTESVKMHLHSIHNYSDMKTPLEQEKQIYTEMAAIKLT